MSQAMSNFRAALALTPGERELVERVLVVATGYEHTWGRIPTLAEVLVILEGRVKS